MEQGAWQAVGLVCAEERSLLYLLHLWSCPSCAQVKHLATLHLAFSQSRIKTFSQSYQLPLANGSGI